MVKMSIYFDGGARPTNPGMAYGSYRIHYHARPEYELAGKRIEFGYGSNNQAEYMALIRALEHLTAAMRDGELKDEVFPGAISLTCYSDSRLVVEQVSGRWKVRKRHIKLLHSMVKTLLKQFGHWNIKWNSRNVNVSMFGH